MQFIIILIVVFFFPVIVTYALVRGLKKLTGRKTIAGAVLDNYLPPDREE